ncbi:MAG: ABC transporter substrate-binding protein [Clostridiales Family XIII bacterium]|nr:ABC transporter substrate-binding protein [Clostridiales Family XIII bacterium]
MKKSITALLVATFLLAGVFASCGGEQAVSTTQPDSQVTADATDADSELDAYEPVTITNGDRTVTFTEMPQRVVAFNSYITENMLALGLGDKIVATNVMSAGNSPLPEYADEYRKIPEIQEKSHELALGYEPDFVAGQVSSFTDKAWGTVDMFEQKGINCYIISGTLAADETIDHIYEDIDNLGRIFKVEDRADALIGEMKAKVADVTDITSTMDEKVTVFVMDSNNGNEIYTTSSGLESQLIELAGGTNVTKGAADSRWFNMSVETLVDLNPDIIVFNEYGETPVEEKIAFINENPALADITAVKDQNYVVIPLQDVMQDVRAADTVSFFFKAFYPDLAS